MQGNNDGPLCVADDRCSPCDSAAAGGLIHLLLVIVRVAIVISWDGGR